jgi:isopentenyl diphosphate isomerase/L-lactate dehydrogenase-like FMN-dependent dehydrogenase
MKRLPRSIYSALIAGSEAGVTLADNVAAFGELGFAPHVGGAPANRDMTTTVTGEQISLPVLISPTGVQSVHPEGELASPAPELPQEHDAPRRQGAIIWHPL